ncbi:MAG: hypothetical protein JW909_07600 [Planctomycetes bacterium]|nr:hypothetical protein [Planctomycetota bacterium]
MSRALLPFALLLVSLGCEPATVTPGPDYPGPAVQPPPEELPSVSPQPRRVAVKDLAGLENSDRWFVEKWGNPADPKNVVDPELGSCLALNVKTGKSDKAAFGFLVSGAYDRDQRPLRIDFFNPGASTVKVAVGLFTARARRYLESPTVELHPGWSSHAFDVSAKQWKSETAKWQFSDSIGSEAIEQLDVLVYATSPVSLFVTYVSEPLPVEPPPSDAPQLPSDAPPASSDAPGGSSAEPAPSDAPPDVLPPDAALTPDAVQDLRSRLSEEDKALIREALDQLED